MLKLAKIILEIKNLPGFFRSKKLNTAIQDKGYIDGLIWEIGNEYYYTGDLRGLAERTIGKEPYFLTEEEFDELIDFLEKNYDIEEQPDEDDEIDEIKNISNTNVLSILKVGGYYDLKLWFSPPHGISYGEYYEPYPGTINGEEGWYWSKDWRYRGTVDGKYVFTDAASAFDDEKKLIDPSELRITDIRPTKED